MVDNAILKQQLQAKKCIIMHTCNYILCTFNEGHSWCIARFEYVKIAKTYSSTTLGLLQSHMVHQTQYVHSFT
jgi:hypothetical protein